MSRNGKPAGRGRPHARANDLVVRKLDGEILVYDCARDRASCLNAFAGMVWERCDGQTSAAAIARALSTASANAVDERAVWLALDALARAQLLQQPIEIPATVLDGASRRAVLRTLGLGAAATIPLVTSILVPNAADAQSCRAAGVACTIGSQCCSGICDGVCIGNLAAQ